MNKQKQKQKSKIIPNMNLLKKPDSIYIIELCAAVCAVMFVMWTFTGKWPWLHQPYNSYVLQVKSWLEGRLDLGQNYKHLELAIFGGKYYVSFPPFPSFLVLPFVMLGWDDCDGMIALVSAVLAAVYAYKILQHFDIRKERAVMFSLLLTVGSNWLLTAQTAYVWFIAQNLAFTLSLMALYYALKNKAALSLAFWACAVGCRPLQGTYLPLLLYLLYNAHKAENPNDKLLDIIKKRWISVLPMAVIALVYMGLNFARFGNPLEFGHVYLPEFVNAENGQFSLHYLKQNLPRLFRMPKISFDKPWEYQRFDGTSMFMISPIILSLCVYAAKAALKREITDKWLIILVFAVTAAELFFTCCHRTMGGYQFGNRYVNDVLPVVFLGLAALIKKEDRFENLNYILLMWGFSINILGSVIYYMNF